MSDLSIQADFSKLFKELEEGIMDFGNNFPLEQFKQGNFKQHPSITLLACSDSRVPGTMVGNLFNRVFSIENIGNQVKTSEGSILYGLLHLKTPIMLVSGHSDCGAIKAAGTDFTKESRALRAELDVVKNSLDEGRKLFFAPLDNEEDRKNMQLAELNVDVQIKDLLSNYEVNELVNKKKLIILGIMLDLHNVYESGYGQIYISNVNGERNINKISEHHGIAWFSRQVKKLT